MLALFVSSFFLYLLRITILVYVLLTIHRCVLLFNFKASVHLAVFLSSFIRHLALIAPWDMCFFISMLYFKPLSKSDNSFSLKIMLVLGVKAGTCHSFFFRLLWIYECGTLVSCSVFFFVIIVDMETSICSISFKMAWWTECTFEVFM